MLYNLYSVILPIIPFVLINMSVPTTITEIGAAVKELKTGIREAIKTVTGLSVKCSKLETKLDKTESKLEEAKLKGKATGKKVVATEASNSAAAASESSSTASEKPLTATAAKALPEVLHLMGLLEQLDGLMDLVKGLPKPGKVKAAKSAESDAEPKRVTNAHMAWHPSILFKDEWEAYKAACQPARDALQVQIDALDPSDPELAEMKKRKKQIGSVIAFNALCRESTHKAEWEAFQAAWAVEHPKKGGAMGGGGAL